jgi:hypothetical protein
MKTEIEASASELPKISSFLSAKDKNISDDSLVSGVKCNKISGNEYRHIRK